MNQPSSWETGEPRLGLIGGIGTAAGVYYYRRLAERLNQERFRVDLLLAHAEFSTVLAFVQAGDSSGLCGYLCSVIDALAGAGCTRAAIAAATSHLCIDELQERSAIPLISLIDAVRTAIEQRGLGRVCVFGTRYVMDSDLLGALQNVEVARLRTDEVDRVDSIYTSLARRGSIITKEREELERLGVELMLRERIDAVILGGTDLSAAFEGRDIPFPVFDASDAHISAIVSAMSH